MSWYKDRDSSKVESLQQKFGDEEIEFKATILPDVDHNSIHWKLAKDPKVWEWLFEQKLP